MVRHLFDGKLLSELIFSCHTYLKQNFIAFIPVDLSEFSSQELNSDKSTGMKAIIFFCFKEMHFKYSGIDVLD